MGSETTGGWRTSLPVRQGKQALDNHLLTNTALSNPVPARPVGTSPATQSIWLPVWIFASLSARDFPSGQSVGSFDLSLKPEDRPANPTVGWQVFTAVPLTSERARFSIGPKMLSSVADIARFTGIPKHRFSLYFSASSGALMIRCIADNITIEEGGAKMQMKSGENRLIRQTTTTIDTGRVVFQLKLLIAENTDFVENRIEEYFANIDDFYVSRLGLGFSRFVRAIPGYNLGKSSIDQVDVDYSCCIYSTKYSAIREGIEVTTGYPIACKTIDCLYLFNRRAEVLNSSQLQSRIIQSRNILRAWETLGEGVSVVPLLAWHLPSSVEDPALEFSAQVLTYRGYSTFAEIDWLKMAVPVKAKLSLIKQTLTGLHRLHRAGICHRHIDASHLIVVSVYPPRAGIIGLENAAELDLGKFLSDAFYDTDNVELCQYPPDLWNLKANNTTVSSSVQSGQTYNHSVDIWAWAITIAKCIGFPPKWKKASDDTVFKVNVAEFDRWAVVEGKELRFVEEHLWRLLSLLKNMIQSHNPSATATDALQHPCWMDVGTHVMPVLPSISDTPDVDNDTEMGNVSEEPIQYKASGTSQSVNPEGEHMEVRAPSNTVPVEVTQPASNVVPKPHEDDDLYAIAAVDRQEWNDDDGWDEVARDLDKAMEGYGSSDEERMED